MPKKNVQRKDGFPYFWQPRELLSKLSQTTWRRLLFVVLALVIVFQATWLWAPDSFKRSFLSNTTVTPPSLEKLAQQVVASCATAAYRPSCYDEEIPKLMDSISMEDAFQVTVHVQQQDPEYAYCHVLGHYLSDNETKKDPSKWKQVITRCPTGVCSNGCIHGAFQERFRVESLPDVPVEELKSELWGICDPSESWQPTGLERATCYHALGHLTMYITEADAQKAVVLCEELTKDGDATNFRHLCYDGAFMQIFQPLEEEDFALIEGKQPTKEEVPEFCRGFSTMAHGSCWSESWPLFAEEIKQPDGMLQFCGYSPAEAEQKRCRSAMYYVLTAQFGMQSERIHAFCRELPKTMQQECYSNAAGRVIENDRFHLGKGVGVCGMAEDPETSLGCYSELVKFAQYSYNPGSPEVQELCEALPQEAKNFCN